MVLDKLFIDVRPVLNGMLVNQGGQIAERLGSQAINQKVVGSIPGCAK